MKNKILIFIISIISNILFLHSTTFAEVISVNTTISTDTTYSSLTVTNGATLTLNAVLTVTGDATVETGGNITHTAGASTNFLLDVAGTLTINSGGKIDVSEKGTSTLGVGTTSAGASHGGYPANSNKAPYGDIYNPVNVGSYGYTSTFLGGGLVRITTGNLINNGSILSNARNYSSGDGQGSGGAINIVVNGNISGNGIFQANGGNHSSNTIYNGAGGRIAIKFNSATDLTLLKNNISATGPGGAGEGTIYLKNNTTNDEYLLIKGHGVAGKNTTVGTGYSDYYFDTIEVNDGAKFYKQGSENIVAGLCILGGNPVGEVGPGIICNGISSFKYYDLNISIKKFDSKNRKHELLITGPSGGYELIGSATGVINGNGNFTKKIKITKTGTYNFTFKLFDSDLTDAAVNKTVIKTVNVTN